MVMGIYECTLHEKIGGESRPVYVDGLPVTGEFVADNIGKARAKFWRMLREVWEEVKIQDIRVRSLNRKKADPMAPGWELRLERANQIIRVIAAHGRHFLSENSDKQVLVPEPFIAHFRVDKNGELWYVDRYSRKSILIRHREWPGFTDGGTLRGIVGHLAENISRNFPINLGYFGNFPAWAPDIWGYGEEEQRKVSEGVLKILEGA